MVNEVAAELGDAQASPSLRCTAAALAVLDALGPAPIPCSSASASVRTPPTPCPPSTSLPLTTPVQRERMRALFQQGCRLECERAARRRRRVR